MSNRKTCRVLFVEDEAVVSMLIEDMLEDLGVRVLGPAATLSKAMALARSEDIDAAILDLNVGGELTYPVADVLRERGISFIFSTGYAQRWLPERFRDVPTLHKPYDQHSFAQALRRALDDSPCEIKAA